MNCEPDLKESALMECVLKLTRKLDAAYATIDTLQEQIDALCKTCAVSALEGRQQSFKSKYEQKCDELEELQAQLVYTLREIRKEAIDWHDYAGAVLEKFDLACLDDEDKDGGLDGSS